MDDIASHRQCRQRAALVAPDAVNRGGILHRIFSAMMLARQRQVDREIGRLFIKCGGRVTDDVEQRLMERVMHDRLF